MLPVVPKQHDKPADSCKVPQLEQLPFNELELALLAQGLAKLLESEVYRSPGNKVIKQLRTRLNRAKPQ